VIRKSGRTVPSFTPVQDSEPPIPVADAQSRVLESVTPLATERVDLRDALGRVLREDVVAAWDVPGADNSAMDGYAVRAVDLIGASAARPVRLRVVGDVPAGSSLGMHVGPGEAARIMTGASIPDGADAVAQVEVTDGGSTEVLVRRELPEGANVRRRGEDIREGARVLADGALIGPGEVGVLAAAGRSAAVVGRRPRVAIVSTGSELVEPGSRPGPGQVTNSNTYALDALVKEAGGEPRLIGMVPDTFDGTVDALSRALDCDIILTSGGVSVGAYDFVKDAVAAVGGQTRFWRVAMKPGKPILFAVREDRLIFGLPGNPVSSMVGFHLFVAPAIRKQMGRSTGWLPPRVAARAGTAMTSKGDRQTYLRVRVRSEGNELVAHPMKAQGSGVTTSMIGANGLAVIPEGVNRVEVGGSVDVVLIGAIDSA